MRRSMSQLFSILGLAPATVAIPGAVPHETCDRDKDLFGQNIQEVNIELSNFCNRQCFHCPRERVRRRDAKNINDDLLEKILSELRSINFSGTIHTHLYNEPLYDPEYWIACYRLIKQGLPNCKVGIATNGDYLDADLFKTLIDLCVDILNVTIYYTVWNEVEQLSKLTKYMEKIGLDGEVISTHYGIFLKKQINQTTFHLRSVNFEKAGQDRGGSLREGVNKVKRSTPCGLPRAQFNINFDGEVFPCCNILPRKEINAQYAMGSVRDKSLFEIYAGAEFTKFRTTVEAINGEDSEMPDCCRFCSDGR
jgi:MoaA/NifB/PqqE/SkfB family radical SAM enzyme